jgi:peptidyl-prolyl cis-trans isomerase C
MKTIARSVVIIALVGFVLAPVGALAAEKPVSETPAAVVNGTTITQEALAFETQRMIEQMARQRQGQVPDEASMPQVREDVLNRMIEEELLYQDSQSKDIKVPEASVAEELASIKQRFPSEKEYQDALAGIEMSEADLTRKITRGMAIEQLIKEHVIQETAVSDAESRAFYDQNASMFEKPEQIQARHILIKMEGDVTEAQKAEALKKIEMIRKKALEGEDFAALASEYSEGPSSVKGGDLGHFSRGQMVKPFEDAAFALKTGEISEVVETQFGYHIIEVTDQQPASVVSYETVQAQIVERLKQEKSRREIQQYIETLRSQADIERN